MLKETQEIMEEFWRVKTLLILAIKMMKPQET